MSRLIDVDALKSIKYHPLPYTHIVPDGVNAEAYERGWNDAVDVIVEDAPTIEPDQKTVRWIPCNKRLLEAEVLCCDIRGGMIIGYPYQDDESETGYSAVSDDVYMIDCIAWMPLPKPWKGDEQDGNQS